MEVGSEHSPKCSELMIFGPILSGPPQIIGLGLLNTWWKACGLHQLWTPSLNPFKKILSASMEPVTSSLIWSNCWNIKVKRGRWFLSLLHLILYYRSSHCQLREDSLLVWGYISVENYLCWYSQFIFKPVFDTNSRTLVGLDNILTKLPHTPQLFCLMSS